jgi:hypothetical protein
VLEESERLCRQLGKLDGLAACLNNQTALLLSLGDLDEALAAQQEAERLARQLGDLDGLAHSLGNGGLILRRQGDLEGPDPVPGD